MANLTMSPVDDDFGPFFKLSGRQSFDFTFFFEDTILTCLPSSLLLLSAPFRIAQLWRAPRKVKTSHLRKTKLALLTVFSLLQTANLAVWSSQPKLQTRASLASASLSLATALALFILSDFEHMRCIRPSSIINAYLLVTVPLDAVKVRTLWLRTVPFLAVLASIILFIKFLILIAEATEKRRILLSPYSNSSPEAISGLYAQGLFWWLNPIFFLGYKSILRDEDLLQTDKWLASELLQENFEAHWSRRDLQVPPMISGQLLTTHKGKENPRRHELILVMARCMCAPLAAAIFPRICQTFFRYMQPFLISRTTSFIDQPESWYVTNQGWGLTAAYGLVYIGIAISSAIYNHKAYRLTTMIRGAIVTKIYSKTLDMSIIALDETAAVTLMSTDVQRICDALALVHELWACPIDIGLSIWLLEAEVGIVLLGPLAISILAVSLLLTVASRMTTAQKHWLAKIQNRVNLTAQVLQRMKGVKMLGLTSKLGDIIQQSRLTEIASSIKWRRLMAYSLICGNVTDMFAPGVAFAVFVTINRLHGRDLTASTAYTILSLISLLAAPVKVLINFAIPRSMAAVGSFDRVQHYLLSTSRQDHRVLMPRVHGLQNIAFKKKIPDEEHIKLENFKSNMSQNEIQGKGFPTLRAVNCTLAWNDSTREVVRDASFEVFEGLTMLVGPVGSGKSSLLKGLLGEIAAIKGYVYMQSLQAAFVDQTPWIQHGTLRENILGMSAFDHEFYARVVHACALDQDFEGLAKGDRTSVGSGGTGLSGGQKLRVALARAVYSRQHIIILDDVLSGLDTVSEERIFSRLLGTCGLLRHLGTTTLLATHAAHRLSFADKIIALDITGSICEQGSFSEVMRIGGYVSSLATTHTMEVESTLKEAAAITDHTDSANLAETNAIDDLDRPIGDWGLYKYYFAAAGYGSTILFLGLMVMYAFFLQFTAFWVKFWTSAISIEGNVVNARYLGILFSFAAGALVSLTWLVFHAYTGMVPRSALRLHESLLNTIRNAPLSFFATTNIGQVVNRFSQDMNVVDFELPWALFEFTASSCIALMQAILICLSAAYFATIVPAVLGLMYFLQKFYLRTSRQVRLMDLEAKSPLYANFIESLKGLVTIRAFGWSSGFEQRNRTLLDDSQRPFYLLFCIQRWLNLVLDLMVAGLAVFLMILIVALRQNLDGGLVGVALLNLMNLNLSLTEVIKQWTALETSMGAVSRVKTFVEATASEHLPQETQLVFENWPSRGSISLFNASASYHADGPLILKDITLSIPAGQKIGLVGRSGSGKSSFVALLFHMLEIKRGSVVIDELDIATIPRERLRERLNVIPQEPVFFCGSIRANLNPFSLAKPESNFVSALSTVGLWNKISVAGGLDIPLDAENLLSHGQRQLFCLARAIVNQSQSRILILDEATASVDIQTDGTMQEIIRSKFKHYTIIAVAHRLGTVADFDRIIVLDQGCIIEDGTPRTLLDDETSQFRQLWDS